VYLSGNTTWNQDCTANITSIGSTSSAYGVYFVGTRAGTATWNQYGNVMVTANTYAVYFEACGTWNQGGTNNIHSSAIHSSNCSIINAPSPSASPTVSPSASPSHLPIVSPVVQNIMAKFSSCVPHVNISTPLGGTHIGFGIAFDEAVAMGASNTTITSESSYKVTNSSHAMTTTFMYQSNLVDDGAGSNATRQAAILEQVFSFSNTSQQQASLRQNSTTSPILPGAIKWSLQINASESNSTTTFFTGGLNITFSLSDLSFSLATAPATITNATVRLSTTAGSHTSSNITTVTTYYLPLLNPQAERLVGVLEVPDAALVDDVLVAINHSILSPSSYNNLSAGGLVYKLVLRFPAFNSSLAYDPSLNLGVVVAHQASSGGPTTITTWLIVGVTVGISVGVGLVIVGSMVVGIMIAKWRLGKQLQAVNFDGSETNE